MRPDPLTTPAPLEPGEVLWAALAAALALLALLGIYHLGLTLHRRWVHRRYGFELPVQLGEEQGGEEPR